MLAILILALAIETRLLGVRGLSRDALSGFRSLVPEESFNRWHSELGSSQEGAESATAEADELIRDLAKLRRQLAQDESSAAERLADAERRANQLAERMDAARAVTDRVAQEVDRTERGMRRFLRAGRITVTLRVFYAVAAGVGLVGAELFALVTLAEESYSTAQSDWVFGGVALGLVGVIVAGLRLPAAIE